MTPLTSLAGLRVIVTRPVKQAAIWCASLRELGATCVSVPMLVLEPVRSAEQIQAIKDVVLDFDLYQKAIFVSQNAVEFALPWLEDYWPQLPRGPQYFAVGETTARFLQHYGLPVSALAAASDGAMNSESLLMAPELQHLQDEKIVIFRGCGGRGKLAEVLRNRGASVSYCELYERSLPAQAEQELHAALTDPNVGDLQQVIALHSGESLQHFLQVLARIKASAADVFDSEKIMRTPVLVPGQRVAELAHAAGFTHILVAENATDRAMSAALLNYVR